MAETINMIQQELTAIRSDLDFIKYILSENLELSDFAKKELKAARELPELEYVDL